MGCCVHQTKRLDVRVVDENCLNHFCPELRVSNPLELTERSELWKRSAEYTLSEGWHSVTARRRGRLTSYEIERISFLIRPVQP